MKVTAEGPKTTIVVRIPQAKVEAHKVMIDAYINVLPPLLIELLENIKKQLP